MFKEENSNDAKLPYYYPTTVIRISLKQSYANLTKASRRILRGWNKCAQG